MQLSSPPKCGHLHAESSYHRTHNMFHGLFVAYTYFSVLVFELRKLLLFLRWVFYHKVTFSTLIYLLDNYKSFFWEFKFVSFMIFRQNLNYLQSRENLKLCSMKKAKRCKNLAFGEALNFLKHNHTSFFFKNLFL